MFQYFCNLYHLCIESNAHYRLYLRCRFPRLSNYVLSMKAACYFKAEPRWASFNVWPTKRKVIRPLLLISRNFIEDIRGVRKFLMRIFFPKQGSGGMKQNFWISWKNVPEVCRVKDEPSLRSFYSHYHGVLEYSSTPCHYITGQWNEKFIKYRQKN